MNENTTAEYDSAAKWCAQRGYKGDFANQLPEGISEKVFWEISNDVEAFQQRIRETAYALAMEKKI